MVDSVQRFGCPPHRTEKLLKMVPLLCQSVSLQRRGYVRMVNKDRKLIRLVVMLMVVMLIMIMAM